MVTWKLGVVVLAAITGWTLVDYTDGRTTIRCQNEPECKQLSDAECGGKNNYRLWRHRRIGHPRWWLLETPESFEIECTPRGATATTTPEPAAEPAADEQFYENGGGEVLTVDVPPPYPVEPRKNPVPKSWSDAGERDPQ